MSIYSVYDERLVCMLLKEPLVLGKGRVGDTPLVGSLVFARPMRDLFLAWDVFFWITETSNIPTPLSLHGYEVLSFPFIRGEGR